MTKQTKAQAALVEAQQWIDAAREEVKEREADLERAQSGLQMYLTIYDVLEKTFARVATPAKKVSKVASKKASKFKRASGLGEAIKGNLQRRDATSAADGIPCTYQYPKGGINSGQICDEALHNPVHEITGGYASYHAFQPASTEQSAAVGGS